VADDEDNNDRETNKPRFARLLAFARELQLASTFGDLLLLTREQIIKEVGYGHAWLMVSESEPATELRLIDYAGAKRGDAFRFAPLLKIEGDSMLEEIVAGDQPVVVVDARTDPRTNKALVEALGNRTIINIPLRLLDKPFGIIGTGTFGDTESEGVRAPTADQLEYLVGMASQIAVAAGRIRLLEERRRTSEAMAKRAAVMEAALDAILLMDVDGRLTEMNESAVRLFGYSREEAVGKLLEELIVPPALREAHRAGLERVRNNSASPSRILGRRIELSAMRKDGSEFPAEIAVVRIEPSAEGGFTGYIRDISERKKAEEAELLRSAKEAAEAANKELESFSYSVAHDLRGPLRGISGFAAILTEDQGAKLNDEGRQHLARIVSGANHMGEIIDALLSLAKVTRTNISRRSIDLHELAASVIASLQERYPRPTSVTVDIINPQNHKAVADPQLVRLVLENLLGNAWKFSAKNPKARIEVGAVPASSGPVVHFVRDNGVGFDMTYADKLFSPFQRLHTKEEFAGTGIGLATVRRIIERHGGKIWAESVANPKGEKSTTFFFTLMPERSSSSNIG
jgi:PAS domain S-box-containing protein